MVHESLGPVDGFVSQNCVCNKSPPGELKQQVSTAELLLQLNCGYGQFAEEPASVDVAEPIAAVAIPLRMRFTDGIADMMMFDQERSSSGSMRRILWFWLWGEWCRHRSGFGSIL